MKYSKVKKRKKKNTHQSLQTQEDNQDKYNNSMQILKMTNNRQPNSGKVIKTSCRTLWYHPYCVPNPNLLFQNTCIPKRQRWFWGCHKIAGCDNYRKNEKSKEDKGRLLLSLICSERKLPDLISHKQVIIHRWPKMLTQENVRQYFFPRNNSCVRLKSRR